MADDSFREQTEPSSMQESWVNVQEQEETLVHSRSKEELEKLLASAASEEERSDSDTMYRVIFKPSSVSPEQEDEQEPFIKVSVPITTRPSNIQENLTEPTSPFTCSGLLLYVPVLILTHLAMFGIGYYIGKRMCAQPTLKLLHI